MRRVLLIAFAALIAAGLVYERIGERRDRNRFPRIGQAIDIGGRSLNLFCSGSGAPTVVFEGAGHTAGLAWADMQRAVAERTRACWYDRAGYGWSDPGPSPRTFSAIATDLHALLAVAKVPPPYVLVGATAGAFHVRVYNAMYPAEVAGAVLIHADDPDVFAHEPEYMKGRLGGLPVWVQGLGCHVLRPTMLRLGVIRLLGAGGGRPYGMRYLDAGRQRELLFLSTNPSTTQTEGEGCVLDESMAQVRSAGGFGDRPLAVLATSERFRAPSPRYDAVTVQLNSYWFDQLQPRLASLSTKGHLFVDANAEEPQSIVRAALSVVDSVRVARPK